MPKHKPPPDDVAHSPDAEKIPPETYPGQRAFEGAARQMFANATPPDPSKRKPRRKTKARRLPSRGGDA